MAEHLNIAVPSALVHLKPNADSEISNQLLFGEEVAAIDPPAKGWVHIQSIHDSYRGYVREDALAAFHAPPTHRINTLGSHVYAKPDFKTPPLHHLYFLSPLALSAESKNGFIKLENGGWVFEEHVMPIAQPYADYVATALCFLGVPYLWGGRSAAGIDCSGLAQIALMAAGRPCPRDTKDQIGALGQAIEPDAPLKRGDLVFFKRHVGIMLDEKQILNATSRHMQVCVETVKELERAYNGILGVRRL